jgi:hypothetical protein
VVAGAWLAVCKSGPAGWVPGSVGVKRSRARTSPSAKTAIRRVESGDELVLAGEHTEDAGLQLRAGRVEQVWRCSREGVRLAAVQGRPGLLLSTEAALRTTAKGREVRRREYLRYAAEAGG